MTARMRVRLWYTIEILHMISAADRLICGCFRFYSTNAAVVWISSL